MKQEILNKAVKMHHQGIPITKVCEELKISRHSLMYNLGRAVLSGTYKGLR